MEQSQSTQSAQLGQQYIKFQEAKLEKLKQQYEKSIDDLDMIRLIDGSGEIDPADLYEIEECKEEIDRLELELSYCYGDPESYQPSDRVKKKLILIKKDRNSQPDPLPNKNCQLDVDREFWQIKRDIYRNGMWQDYNSIEDEMEDYFQQQMAKDD
jgi:hypothetical protein